MISVFPEPTKPNIDELATRLDVGALAVALSFPNEPQIRTKAIEALLGIGSPQAIESLTVALKKSYFYDVRRNAATALGKSGDEMSKGALVDALSDPVEDVRFAAAFALSEFRDSRANEILLLAQKSQDKEISAMANASLIKLKEQKGSSYPKIVDEQSNRLKEPEHKANDLNDKGVNLANAGNYAEAIKCFNKALEIDRKFALAWFNQALIYQTMGQNEKALQSCNEALEISPKDAGALYKKACLEDTLGRKKDVARSYKEFLEYCANQNSAEAKSAKKRLVELEQSGKNAPKKVTKGDEDFSNELKNKADYLDTFGNKKESIASYNEASRINPNNIDAWYNKGLVLEKEGDFQGALKCFGKVLELNPQDAGAWYNRACNEDKLNRRFDTITSFKKFLDYSNNEKTTEIEHARKRLREMGIQYEKNTAYKRTYITEEDQRRATKLRQEADYLDKIGRQNEALNSYDKAIKANPKDLDVWFNKAITLEQTHQYKEALNCYNQILEENPKDCAAWYNKATCEDELQMEQQALNSYKSFLKITPAKYSQEAKHAKKRVEQLS